jgi:aspartyl-tRNA(Asn)/glutamyl-tRNA(Gln) amidotransferase subunit A
MNNLPWFSLVELTRAIAARQVSPLEIIRAHLARIQQLDGRLKCYLSVFTDAALEAAQVAERAVMAGQPLGPLHGVPVAVKDLFAVQGTPTTAGSRFLTEPAVQDCTVVARLRAAGAILLGKLNLHEFAYGPEGTNPHYGTPWNPWDAETQRMPGGSSSGSGVAVAAGLTPMGLGSDTGGSIRIPAACCGTVGLKPTYGRVSRGGVVPLSWSLDHVGPLTRRVADAALVLRAIAGYDPADPSSSRLPVADYLAALAAPVRGLRIGLCRDFVNQADSEIQAALEAAIRVFQELECTVQDVTLPTLRYSLGASNAIAGPEAMAHHRSFLQRHAADYAPDVRRRILVGGFLTGADYVKGQRARQLLRNEVNGVLERVDGLLAPTLPVAAPPVAATEVKLPDGMETVRLALTMFTRSFNLSGHPVVCVPCGFNRQGLPLSLQLIGRAFEESTILRLAKAYEDATAWHQRRPPLAAQ